MTEALVAGHICLDMIPAFAGKVTFDPGRLIEVGPATLSTGGAVSNTGQVLYKLGVDTKLCGKIGDDTFGTAIRGILESTGSGLSSGMTISRDELSSYSVVISLTGEDRMFLHAPGCNDTFVAADVSDAALSDAKLLHFGYPTLMARMFADDGEETVSLLRRAKALGLTTSLDMSLPDLAKPAGAANWEKILSRCLPFTDLFLPNVEELQFMLDRQGFERSAARDLAPSEIQRLADKAIAMGADVVAVKIGDRGLYLKSTDDLGDLGRATPANPNEWRGIELWAPCFRADLVGTTGAGDATVAGLLMGLLKGHSARQAAQMATAVGASSCEAADALSGVPSRDAIERRIADGWPTHDPQLGPGWAQSDGVYLPVT